MQIDMFSIDQWFSIIALKNKNLGLLSEIPIQDASVINSKDIWLQSFQNRFSFASRIYQSYREKSLGSSFSESSPFIFIQRPKDSTQGLLVTCPEEIDSLDLEDLETIVYLQKTCNFSFSVGTISRNPKVR